MVVLKHEPYEFGRGRKLTAIVREGGMNLAPHVCLGIARSKAVAEKNLLEIRQLVEVARVTTDYLHFFREMVLNRLWSRWPADRVREFWQEVQAANLKEDWSTGITSY